MCIREQLVYTFFYLEKRFKTAIFIFLIEIWTDWKIQYPAVHFWRPNLLLYQFLLFSKCILFPINSTRYFLFRKISKRHLMHDTRQIINTSSGSKREKHFFILIISKRNARSLSLILSSLSILKLLLLK